MSDVDCDPENGSRMAQLAKSEIKSIICAAMKKSDKRDDIPQFVIMRRRKRITIELHADANAE